MPYLQCWMHGIYLESKMKTYLKALVQCINNNFLNRHSNQYVKNAFTFGCYADTFV